MGYSQKKSTTGSEKQLEKLKIQLYGKEHTIALPASQFTANTTAHPARVSVEHLENSYVSRDLIKVSVLATIAIAAQLILKFVVKI
jgi:cell division protein ZapA (FtsZ GTPase activity inhibitor)